MYPLFFEPVYKETVWGGDKLSTLFNRTIPTKHTGESWEIASHKNGTSVVANGKYKGMMLDQLINEHKEEVLGSCKEYSKFPLLVKIIDANDKLSIQVHPNDEYAKINENGELGKSEMWYILDAKEDAKLVLGTKKGVSKKDFKEAALNGTLEEYIEEIKVKAGDVINIPAGMLHAIQDGIVLAEIQQNSDTTYRVYDWNRVGLDGKPRELHMDKALDVIDFQGKLQSKKVDGIGIEEGNNKLTYYIANKYFAVERLDLKDKWMDDTDNIIFYLYTCIEGEGIIKYKDGSFEFRSGQSFMIPASLGSYSLEGHAKLLRSYVPEKDKYLENLHQKSGYQKNEISKKVDVAF